MNIEQTHVIRSSVPKHMNLKLFLSQPDFNFDPQRDLSGGADEDENDDEQQDDNDGFSVVEWMDDKQQQPAGRTNFSSASVGGGKEIDKSNSRRTQHTSNSSVSSAPVVAPTQWPTNRNAKSTTTTSANAGVVPKRRGKTAANAFADFSKSTSSIADFFGTATRIPSIDEANEEPFSFAAGKEKFTQPSQKSNVETKDSETISPDKSASFAAARLKSISSDASIITTGSKSTSNVEDFVFDSIHFPERQKSCKTDDKKLSKAGYDHGKAAAFSKSVSSIENLFDSVHFEKPLAPAITPSTTTSTTTASAFTQLSLTPALSSKRPITGHEHEKAADESTVSNSSLASDTLLSAPSIRRRLTLAEATSLFSAGPQSPATSKGSSSISSKKSATCVITPHSPTSTSLSPADTIESGRITTPKEKMGKTSIFLAPGGGLADGGGAGSVTTAGTASVATLKRSKIKMIDAHTVAQINLISENVSASAVASPVHSSPESLLADNVKQQRVKKRILVRVKSGNVMTAASAASPHEISASGGDGSSIPTRYKVVHVQSDDEGELMGGPVAARRRSKSAMIKRRDDGDSVVPCPPTPLLSAEEAASAALNNRRRRSSSIGNQAESAAASTVAYKENSDAAAAPNETLSSPSARRRRSKSSDVTKGDDRSTANRSSNSSQTWSRTMKGWGDKDTSSSFGPDQLSSSSPNFQVHRRKSNDGVAREDVARRGSGSRKISAPTSKISAPTSHAVSLLRRNSYDLSNGKTYPSSVATVASGTTTTTCSTSPVSNKRLIGGTESSKNSNHDPHDDEAEETSISLLAPGSENKGMQLSQDEGNLAEFWASSFVVNKQVRLCRKNSLTASPLGASWSHFPVVKLARSDNDNNDDAGSLPDRMRDFDASWSHFDSKILKPVKAPEEVAQNHGSGALKKHKSSKIRSASEPPAARKKSSSNKCAWSPTPVESSPSSSSSKVAQKTPGRHSNSCTVRAHGIPAPSVFSTAAPLPASNFSQIMQPDESCSEEEVVSPQVLLLDAVDVSPKPSKLQRRRAQSEPRRKEVPVQRCPDHSESPRTEKGRTSKQQKPKRHPRSLSIGHAKGSLSVGYVKETLVLSDVTGLAAGVKNEAPLEASTDDENDDETLYLNCKSKANDMYRRRGRSKSRRCRIGSLKSIATSANGSTTTTIIRSRSKSVKGDRLKYSSMSGHESLISEQPTLEKHQRRKSPAAIRQPAKPSHSSSPTRRGGSVTRSRSISVSRPFSPVKSHDENTQVSSASSILGGIAHIAAATRQKTKRSKSTGTRVMGNIFSKIEDEPAARVEKQQTKGLTQSAEGSSIWTSSILPADGLVIDGIS